MNNQSTQSEEEKKVGRLMKGVVASDKMNKTVVVAVTRLKEHPKYRKRYKVTEKYKAHDENNEFRTGDLVMVQETRPMSKDKKWTVVELVKKGSEKVDQEAPREGEEAKADEE